MMKRLMVLPMAVLAACSSTYTEDDVPETYEPYWDVRDHGTLESAPEDGGTLQYAVHCRVEQRLITGWMESRSGARSAASDHRSKTEWHTVSVLGRQPDLPSPPRYDIPNAGAHEDITDDIPPRPRRYVTDPTRRP